MPSSPQSPTRSEDGSDDDDLPQQQQQTSPPLATRKPKTPPIAIHSSAVSSSSAAGSLKPSSLKHHSPTPSSQKKTVTFTPIESSILTKNLKDQENKKTSITTSSVMVDIEDDPPSTKYYQIGDDDDDNTIKVQTTPTSATQNTAQPITTPRSTKSSSKKNKKPIVFNHTVLTWFRTQRQSLKQRRANATPEDMLSTGPLTKFWKYGKIPWKMMIQIALVILMTVQVVLLSQHRNYFFISSDASFATQFLKDGFENYEQSLYGFYTSYFYNAQEVVDDISKTVSTYYSFPQKNVDIWVFPRDIRQRDLIKPIRIDIQLFKDNPRLFGTGDYGREPFVVESDILTKRDPLGVVLKSYLSNSTRDFFDRLHELTLTINLVGLDRSNFAVNNYAECVFWTLKKIYKNGEGGRLMAQLRRTYDVCRTTDRALYMEYFKPAIWMSMLIFMFSMVALVLDIKAIFARIRLFKKIRDLEVKKQGTKNEYSQSGNAIKRFFQKIVHYRISNLSLSDIPKILSYWVIFSITQHCINILTFILQLAIPGKTIEVSFFVGLGALLTWSSTLRFFQFSPNFYMFSKAFERGLPQVIRFIITTLPLYFGFALLGTIMFGEYSKYFFDVNEAMVTLFSLIFQDNMRDTFDSVFGYQGFTAFFSRLYIYIYTTIFICVIANVFTSIMEDAFFSLKENQENLEAQVNKNTNDDETSSTSSGESDVSIINVSINDLSEDAEDAYLQQVINKEEEKEQKILSTKEQYFPQDDYASLKYILEEESIKDNVERIVTIVKALCKNKSLSEEEEQLLKAIENKAASIYSKSNIVPGLDVDQEELQEHSDLLKTKED
ncbi:hypothetical protein C9374_002039 [Naegleria lovaniensis]|uniref:Polycystin cation channel PKD1/PKD2 domain-containing protein n=1 Tax=Naegleria lovaniensis TaxID=51637 RepID=A0AA88GWG1_NAELO|nr:uncharacterized protein C9374_002039 [Naegleria lovaniensis]KAG2387004.1 hypothetical protein C9374_002039 [Naegleria lovaniensis]